MRDLQQMCLCAVVLKNGSTGSPNRKGSDGGVHHDLQRSNKLHEKHKQWLQWKRLIALTASAFACCHFASAEGWSAQTARTRVARTNWLFYIFFKSLFSHSSVIYLFLHQSCLKNKWSRLTAFAGKARSMTALKPLYREATPSSLISSRRTSRKPLGYFPSGAERKTLY